MSIDGGVRILSVDLRYSGRRRRSSFVLAMAPASRAWRVSETVQGIGIFQDYPRRDNLNFLETFSLRRCCVIPRVGSHAPTNGVESTGQRNGAQPQLTAPLAHSARTESGAHLELPTATSHWPIPKLSCKHSRTLGSTLQFHNSLCIHICFLLPTPFVSPSIIQSQNGSIHCFPLRHCPFPQGPIVLHQGNRSKRI